MSSVRVALERIARLSIAAISLATSLYAVLAYVPFTAVHFLEFRHFDALARFVELHPLLVVLAWLPYAGARLPELAAADRRPRTVLLLAATAALSVTLSLAAPLDSIADRLPLALAFVWLVPPFVVAVADLRAGGAAPDAEPPESEPSSSIVASALVTATLAAVFYAARAGLLGAAPDPFGVAAAIAAHGIVLAAPALAAAALDAFAAALALPMRARLVVAALPLAVVAERGVRLGGLASISFFGTPAVLYATAFSITLVAMLVGAAWRTAADPSPLRRLLAPLAPRSLAGAALALLVLGAAAHVAIGAVERVDWNELGRRIVAVLSWVLSFAIVHRGLALATSRERPWIHGLALLPLGLFLALGPRMPDASARALADSARVDPSLSTTSSLLRPRTSGAAFYAFLKAHTNLPRSTALRSPEVHLVRELAARSTSPPHVFVVVVDSLRRDYLGPYERRVDFTPAIDAFARDAVVFENAFTRYGATGLSEPSIWTGAMLPHLQYPQPFGPLNALARLLEHERYRAYASVDTILAAILPPSLEVVDVDAARSEKDFDTCGSLAAFAAALDAGASDRPLFFYTQPQDLHVSVRHREGDAPVDDRSYAGFDAAYASRVRRLDACFGRFLGELRRRGLDRDAVVVLTSDHGDSLGEEGRWGHAYTLAPEVVRIPLIVRLPPRLRDAFEADAEELAFSTDVTPTLYRLLGHGPILPDRRFGRPLFRPRGDERARRADAHLLASSYGAVWGLLSGDGRELYVADAVAFEDSRHDLSRAFAGERLPISDAEREVRQARIRDEILALERAYGVGAGGD